MFSGFFLGSLLGHRAGRPGRRPARAPGCPFAVGLALFAVGLVVGGAAQSMPMLVAGRVAQGMGAGVIPAVAYTSVGRSYPAALRPRVFAVFSSAWVIPGVVGPAAASAIAGWASWRVVFLALLPLVAVAAALALPVLSDRAPEPEDGDGDAADASGRDDRPRDAVVLVVGAALVLGGLGAHQVALALALVVAGGVPAAWAFVRLVPDGDGAAPPRPARGHRGPGRAHLRLLRHRRLRLAGRDRGPRRSPTWVAGLALTGATLAWTAGAWVQQRLVVRAGRAGWCAEASPSSPPASPSRSSALGPVPVGLLVAAWTVGGLGMGLCYAPISATVLGEAAPGQEGRASASLQLTDVLGVSLGTGLAGVFVAVGEGRGWATASSLTLAFIVTWRWRWRGWWPPAGCPAASPAERPAGHHQPHPRERHVGRDAGQHVLPHLEQRGLVVVGGRAGGVAGFAPPLGDLPGEPGAAGQEPVVEQRGGRREDREQRAAHQGEPSRPSRSPRDRPWPTPPPAGSGRSAGSAPGTRPWSRGPSAATD